MFLVASGLKCVTAALIFASLSLYLQHQTVETGVRMTRLLDTALGTETTAAKDFIFREWPGEEAALTWCL